jgi:tetratricopeptide (TPR) repeat protein
MIARSVPILVAVFATAAQATAQPAQGRGPKGAAAKPQTPLDQAKALTAQAELDYKVGRFQEALDEYSKAYELYPTPALLFNLGQCHKQLKNHERAVFFFRGYLRDKPDAPNRGAVEGFIADSQRALDEAQAQARKEAEDQERAREMQRAQAEAELLRARQAAIVAPPPPKTAVRIAGLAVAAVGVGAIGAGVFLGLKSHSDANDIGQVSMQGGTWTPSDQSLYSSGQTDATVATALFIGGGVAVAAGGVLTWLGWPKPSAESAPTASFAPVPGGGTFVVRGGF